MKFLSIAAGFIALIASATAAAVDSFPKDQVTIDSARWAGSGCPPGSVSSLISEDRQTLSLLYSKYGAAIGTGTSPLDQYKNCQIQVNLRYPQGWTYTVFRTDYHGYASLEKKVTGVQKSIYYFSSEPGKQWYAQTTFTGPYASDYHFWDIIRKETLVYCKCKGKDSLNINTSVRLASTDSTKKATGLLTVDANELNVKHVLGLQWKRC